MSKVKLADVVERSSGGGTPARDVALFWNGPIPWATVKDFKDGVHQLCNVQESITKHGLNSSSANLIPANTPIVCMRMAVGRIATAPFAIAINQDLRALFVNSQFDADFVVWAIDGIRGQLENEAIGSTVKGISVDRLLSIEILNATLAEQTKIAEVLSTVDRAIEQTEALIAKQQRIKTGLMQDLLTRGIDEHGTLRSEATHAFKDSSLGRIPVEWEVNNLIEVASGGIQNGYFKKPELVGAGYKLINVSEIYQSFGIGTGLKDVERVSGTEKDHVKYGVSQGDVFFTRSSLVLSGIAHCNLIRRVEEPTLFECHVMRVRPNRRKVVPEYLALYCRSHTAKLHLMSRAKQVTMTTISQPELENLDIPVPQSLLEQEMIVKTFLSSEQVIRDAVRDQQKLQRLKTGLMQDLLTGKVRVTPLFEQGEVIGT